MIEDHWTDAHHAWRVQSWEQRLAIISAAKASTTDPAFLQKPRKYIEAGYKTGPRPEPKRKLTREQQIAKNLSELTLED